MMRAFEIHTFTGGKWKIDSVFDDRELAVFEAQRIDHSNRYAGVRVVEETFDEQTQKSTVRTVFRGGRVDVGVPRTPSPPPPARAPEVRRGGGSRGPSGIVKPAARKHRSNGALMIILVLIMVGGIAALGVLRFLPRFL